MIITPEELDDEIRKGGQLTSKSFGVDSVAPVSAVQFDRPLGSCQLIQNYLADISGEI